MDRTKQEVMHMQLFATIDKIDSRLLLGTPPPGLPHIHCRCHNEWSLDAELEAVDLEGEDSMELDPLMLPSM